MDFVACQMVAPRKRNGLDRERLAAISHTQKAAKHKGRNHWRNWERRKMAAEKRKAALAKVEKRNAAFVRYVEATRAYWRGERPDLPGRPA